MTTLAPAAPLSARFRQQAGRLLAVLAPPVPVRVLHADGSVSVWVGSERVPTGSVRSVRHVAVELPEELVLHRQLALPPLADAHVQEALALEVQGASPFPAGDLAWGHALRGMGPGARRADIAMASRAQVGAWLAERWPDLARAPQPPEVWALPEGAPPIVLAGFGEGRRLHSAGRRRQLHWALLGLAALLAMAAALTPTAQLRMRAGEAAAAYAQVSARAAPLIGQRDELFALNERIRQLDAAVAVSNIAVFSGLP